MKGDLNEEIYTHNTQKEYVMLDFPPKFNEYFMVIALHFKNLY